MNKTFEGLSVAVISATPLGDVTIYLRLALWFHQAGARVSFFSNTLYPARHHFSWLNVEREDESLPQVAARFDLVFAFFSKFYSNGETAETHAALTNVAFVTSKRIPLKSGVRGREVVVRGQVYAQASMPFCTDTRSGLSMIDCIDAYARKVFGLTETPGAMPMEVRAVSGERSVVIFPTTPHASKNYWLTGFLWLARWIRALGWRVEFVCMPHEHEYITRIMPGFKVYAFADIAGLIDYLASASLVISNDSGGGHLASMMDIATYTVTRRREAFVWRPGFNQKNTVLRPLIRFKWLGDYVWRPFVPVWRIPKALGRRN
ncbi:glycosyltransferase family 9 protein [Pseudomonas borbori]